MNNTNKAAYIVAASAFLLLSTPAAAESFTGLRVEARGGLDQVLIDRPDTDENDVGGVYGIGAGYDLAVTRGIIAGVEAGFDLASTRARDAGEDSAWTVRTKRDIEVSARIGAVVSQRVLLYVKGGYSNARFLVEGDLDGQPEIGGNKSGLRLGAGLEYKVSESAYAKTEFRNTNYGDGVTRRQIVAGIGIRF